MRRLTVALLLLVIPLCFASSARAQSSGGSDGGIDYQGWGVRVGASADPDQIYGGFHWEMGSFATDVRFRPVIEAGFGDDVKTAQAFAEVHYVFSKVQVWKPYVGGGIGLSWAKVDDAPPGVDDSDTDLGLTGIGGIETGLKSGNRFFMELKIGFGDVDPDVKFGLGWTFR